MIAEDSFGFGAEIGDWDNVGHRIVGMEDSEFQMCHRYSVAVFKNEAVDAQLQGVVVEGTVVEMRDREESAFAVAVCLFDGAVGGNELL